jgi:hypothetical protein
MCNHWIGEILCETEHQQSIRKDDYKTICRREAKRINKVSEALGKPPIKADDLVMNYGNRYFKKFTHCPDCGWKINWGWLLRKI